MGLENLKFLKGGLFENEKNILLKTVMQNCGQYWSQTFPHSYAWLAASLSTKRSFLWNQKHFLHPGKKKMRQNQCVILKVHEKKVGHFSEVLRGNEIVQYLETKKNTTRLTKHILESYYKFLLEASLFVILKRTVYFLWAVKIFSYF